MDTFPTAEAIKHATGFQLIESYPDWQTDGGESLKRIHDRYNAKTWAYGAERVLTTLYVDEREILILGLFAHLSGIITQTPYQAEITESPRPVITGEIV